MYSKLFAGMLLYIMSVLPLQAQKKGIAEPETSALVKQSFSAFAFRNIGPAFTSGRIADIAIHPTNRNIWYVGVASGGVWKTANAGITWTPLFDKEAVFAIGCHY